MPTGTSLLFKLFSKKDQRLHNYVKIAEAQKNLTRTLTRTLTHTHLHVMICTFNISQEGSTSCFIFGLIDDVRFSLPILHFHCLVLDTHML